MREELSFADALLEALDGTTVQLDSLRLPHQSLSCPGRACQRRCAATSACLMRKSSSPPTKSMTLLPLRGPRSGWRLPYQLLIVGDDDDRSLVARCSPSARAAMDSGRGGWWARQDEDVVLAHHQHCTTRCARSPS